MFIRSNSVINHAICCSTVMQLLSSTTASSACRRGDMARLMSALRQAPDAVVLDNSRMSVEEQMAWFMELFERRIAE